MLTSLLSLYIATAIQPQLDIGISKSIQNNSHIMRTASLNFKKIIEENPLPIKNPKYISPIINAGSAIAIDLKTGTILFEKDAHVRRPVASITKLMTTAIILEENGLNEVVEVSNNAAGTEGSQMFLRAGEKITIENLIYGMIIHSANDGAIAVAEHNSGSVEAFVEKMNKKALELGLVNTHFTNPTGLDSPNNYSSASDIAKLARYIYQNPLIKKIATVKNINVTSISGNFTHKLETTNDLLDSFLHIKGLKTGKTEAAGLCLTAIAENDNGNEIISVVLASPARFTETKILIEWVFRAFKWQN